MYASAAQYINEFGIDEATQLLADEHALLDVELLQARLAGNTASHSAEQTAVLDAALYELENKLRQQSNYIDGFIRKKVHLPLAQTDVDKTSLASCCMYLTRMDLMDDADNATDEVSRRVARWDKWLRDIASGTVLLFDAASGVSMADGVATATQKQHHFGVSKSSFDWGGFK